MHPWYSLILASAILALHITHQGSHIVPLVYIYPYIIHVHHFHI
jgi:hypothetical protein